MTFTDRTYCSSDCVNRACFKNLTPELQASAEERWGKNPPYDFADFKTGCLYYKAPGEITP